MQTDKIKKIINNSFVSNHDLLECIRNKSFKMSRDNSKDLKPKVQMIKKKSFENISKENSSFFANRNNNASCLLEPYQSNEGTIDKIIYLIQDCLEQLPQGMQKMRHKLKKSLEMLRNVREEKLKTEVNTKLFESQKENAMLKRIEEQYRQKICIQKQCEALKEKIKILQKKNVKPIQKYASSHTSRKHIEKEDSNLHQIILSQSELINRQCEEHKEQNYEFRNILKTQALQIEKLLRNNHHPKYYFEQD